MGFEQAMIHTPVDECGYIRVHSPLLVQHTQPLMTAIMGYGIRDGAMLEYVVVQNGVFVPLHNRGQLGKVSDTDKMLGGKARGKDNLGNECHTGFVKHHHVILVFIQNFVCDRLRHRSSNEGSLLDGLFFLMRQLSSNCL